MFICSVKLGILMWGFNELQFLALQFWLYFLVPGDLAWLNNVLFIVSNVTVYDREKKGLS